MIPAGPAARPGRRVVAALVGLATLATVHGAGAEPAAPHVKAGGPKRARPRSGPSLGHTVRPGETLWAIARRHGVSVAALAHANRLGPADTLALGRQLTIPGANEPDHQEPPSLAEIVLGAPPDASRLPFMWPVATSVASPFGPRGRMWHGGIDIRAERGTPIRAAAPGMVIMSGRERGYGNVIKVWHHLDLMTVYAHNHENHVRVGEWVERGQVIGTVGRTGRTTAPHLHFEIRLDGRKYDPTFWLPAPGVLEVAAAGGAAGPASAPPR